MSLPTRDETVSATTNYQNERDAGVLGRWRQLVREGIHASALRGWIEAYVFLPTEGLSLEYSAACCGVIVDELQRLGYRASAQRLYSVRDACFSVVVNWKTET